MTRSRVFDQTSAQIYMFYKEDITRQSKQWYDNNVIHPISINLKCSAGQRAKKSASKARGEFQSPQIIYLEYLSVHT